VQVRRLGLGLEVRVRVMDLRLGLVEQCVDMVLVYVLCTFKYAEVVEFVER
jgi:hypothetical protein